MKIILRIFAIVVGLLLLGSVMGYLAGSFSHTIPPGHIAPPMPEVAGPVAAVEQVAEPLIERAPGTVRAKNETSISARITAQLITLSVRSGDSVEEGQVLATLDDRDLRARVSQAEETLRSIEARIDNAQLEFERARQLVEEGAVAQARLDETEATLRSFEADADRARRAVDEAQASLSYASITSPIKGRVIDRYAEPGDIISPGMPILRLYDPDSLRLEADVRESLATTLSRGDKLETRIDALNETFAATVGEIVPQSDAGSRSFIVKATLPPHANLYPGMFGRLLIPTGRADRLYIPSDAIARVGQLEYVVVLEDGKAMRRFIRTAESENGRTEVLSGLETGEQILLSRTP